MLDDHRIYWQPLPLLLLSAPIAATTEPALFDLSLETLLATPVEVVSKYQQRAADAPAIVSVISGDQIRSRGLETLADLIPFLPGFYLNLDSAKDLKLPVASGRGRVEPNILLLIDGQPINDHINKNPFIMSREISLYNIERVELMRGPGSYLYGSAAFIGTINLVSRVSGSEARIASGTHGRRQLSFRLSSSDQPMQQQNYVTFSGDLYRDKGEYYTDLIDRERRTESTYDPRRYQQFQLRGNYQRIGFNLHHTEQRQSQFYYMAALDNEHNYERSYEQSAWLYYRPPLGHSTDGRIGLGFRRQHAEGVTPLVRAADVAAFLPTPLPDDVFGGPIITHQVTTLEARFNTRHPNGHHLSWGAEMQHVTTPVANNQSNYRDLMGLMGYLMGDPTPFTPEYLGQLTQLTEPNDRFVADRDRDIYSLYLHDQFDHGLWHFGMGARYDQFSDIGQQISPHLAVSWRFAPGQQLRASYGEALQAPTLMDLYGQNNPQAQGNPALKPEQIRSLALEYLNYDARRTLSALLHFDRSNQLIAGRLDGTTMLTDNIASTTTAGLELSGSWQINRAWQLQMTFNQQLLVDNDRLSYDEACYPERFGSVSLDYQHARWQLNLNGWWRNVMPVVGESAQRFNFIGRYRLADDTTLYLRADNLFNQGDVDVAYAPDGIGVDEQGEAVLITPSRSRWLTTGVELTW